MHTKLKVGTKVFWFSQAGGRKTKKRGEIICIVPAGKRPFVLKVDDQKNTFCLTGRKSLMPEHGMVEGFRAMRCRISCVFPTKEIRML